MFGQKRGASRIAKSAVALAIALALTSCSKNVSDDDYSGTPPATDAADVSDQEIYASLTESYSAYLKVADQILTDGGKSPERIRSVSTEAFASSFAADAEEYASANLRSVGSTAAKTLELQSWTRQSNAFNVTAYVCDDVSGIDVLNGDGSTVVSPDRDPTTPYEVSFEGDSIDQLLVSSKTLWTGTDFCDE